MPDKYQYFGGLKPFECGVYSSRQCGRNEVGQKWGLHNLVLPKHDRQRIQIQKKFQVSY